ncbi:type IV secretory system conjugative DNA transfer family protein [Candidatus Enterococcus lemimoniae]|uniref:TraD/TraG TraM recognition site domain-containing protein n=1 Tax=Candidatus Enterococcus lemimoniae TaxID=1834167 RepID=A0ABZ2T863_9ENTE|nr:TraM recognition domain-containing protein [Enterococcus sp. 12C11_DIV0727]OTO71110.1 hypothetical protein A5866_003360 [Enterococcus sp. 12C11_DIV0727]
MKKIDHLSWRKLSWTRPIEFENIQNLVHHLATSEPRKPIIFEIRATSGKISYFLATERDEFAKSQRIFKTHGVNFGAKLKPSTATRKLVKVARKLSISKPILSLRTDHAEELARVMLATMAQASSKDEIVIQLVIASSLPPEQLPKNVPDPSASWWQIISNGTPPTASGDTRTAIKNKVKLHRLRTLVRVGAHSQDEAKAKSYILSVLSVFKMLETGGNKLSLQPEEPANIDNAKLPWKYPRLSVLELANLMLAPIGQEDLSGIAPIHPKILLPPIGMKDPVKNMRAFAETMNEDPAFRRSLHLPVEDNLRGLYIIGPPGSGKSTVLENLVLSTIDNSLKNSKEAKVGCIVIDPKFSLISSLAEKIPEEKLKDTIIWDITSNRPLGINVLNQIDGKSPELAAEVVLSSLRGLFKGGDFGVYTEELLTMGLLTLAQYKKEQMTLLHLPILLSNSSFRKRVCSQITDVYLKSYWTNFEALPEKEQKAQTAAPLRRLNLLLMRQTTRGALGQANPKFDIEKHIFEEGKTLLVPLSEGLTGKTVSELCASLLINTVWSIAQRRSEIKEEDKIPVLIFVDEFQKFVKQSAENFSDILSMGRGLKCGFCLVNQSLDQLPSKEMREIILSNCRSKIIFGTSKTDAKVLADLAPELHENDILLTPSRTIYYKHHSNASTTTFLSGKTLPPRPAIRNNHADVFAKSALEYGRDIDEIEKEYIDLMTQNDTANDELENLDIDLIIGKKTKKKADK